MPRLGVSWVVRREMEVHARRPSWHDGFAYEGLTVPGLLLVLPVLLSVVYGQTIGPYGLLVPLIPYAAYLHQAAAGQVAGSLAVDLPCARRLPVSPASFLLGKCIGSTLHLLVELAMLAPALLLASWRATGSPWTGAIVLTYLAWVVLYGSLFGATCSRTGQTPKESAIHARFMAGLLFLALPAVAVLVLIFEPELLKGSLALLWVLHPAGGLCLLRPPLDATVLLGASLLGLGAAFLLFSLVFFRLRASAAVRTGMSRYIVQEAVGKGSMAGVYRVVDDLTGTVWALKQMSLEGLPPEEADETRALFEREARLLLRLAHPAFPLVLDAFAEGTSLYLVMEMVEGRNLETVVEQNGPCPEGYILPLAQELAVALGVLHRHPAGPVIYRDLKPSNVMLADDGTVRLVDFGIARVYKPGQAADTHVLGTPGFAPPEQWGTSQTTPRSDLYSLGATLHFALTGTDPGLPGETHAPLRALAPSGSPQMEALLERCLQADPLQRPASAAEVLRELEAIPGVASVIGAPVRERRGLLRRWWTAGRPRSAGLSPVHLDQRARVPLAAPTRGARPDPAVRRGSAPPARGSPPRARPEPAVGRGSAPPARGSARGARPDPAVGSGSSRPTGDPLLGPGRRPGPTPASARGRPRARRASRPR